LNYGPQQVDLLRSAVFGGTPGMTTTSQNKVSGMDRIGNAIGSYNAVQGLFG